MKAWINADNGGERKKLEIAAELEKLGFEVHVGETGSNVHYEDYFNVTEDYDYYITLYDGFCSGTVREAYSPGIQDELKKKGVTLVIIWDTLLWAEGMKPYRFGDFTGYTALRAWDDNFSKTDPTIEDVDAFMRAQHAFYCAAPTTEMIMEQFAAGGCLSWNGEHNN